MGRRRLRAKATASIIPAIMPTRADALALVREWNADEGHVKHMLAVESAMRAYARKFGEDEELWGLVGLLHDFDYERYPELADHTVKGGEVLKGMGYPDVLIRAIRSHNDATGVKRESPMEHALFACDEISGLVTACALVRPSKSVSDLEPSSVKKKLKQVGFARSIDREAVLHGPEALGVPFDEHCAFVIAAMRGISADLGL